MAKSKQMEKVTFSGSSNLNTEQLFLCGVFVVVVVVYIQSSGFTKIYSVGKSARLHDFQFGFTINKLQNRK